MSSTPARNLAVVPLRTSSAPAVRHTVAEKKAAAVVALDREGRLKRKIDQSDRVLTKLEEQQAKLGRAIAALQLRKKHVERRASDIEARIVAELEQANRTQAGGYRVMLSTRPCPAAVAITNAALLPKQYVKVETVETPIKALIKAALASDIEVPGAKLTQGTSLLRKAS
jgi:hypothetical protein